ncbi:MAG: hypothetical protein Q8O03_02425 [Nanoarchaeota archaeon]|nr:hypothetical protein [Nanoarchaeota archaeon]
MAKTEEPSVEKVIERLTKIKPSKWKSYSSGLQSYGGYKTELSELLVKIDCTGNSSNNKRFYVLEIEDIKNVNGYIRYAEEGLFERGEISKFYDCLKKKVIAYQERTSKRTYNEAHEKTLDKLLKVLKE